MTRKRPVMVLHDKEIILYENDIQSIQDGEWVKGNVITFYSRFLERKYQDLFNDHYFRIFYLPYCQMFLTFPRDVVQKLPKIDLSIYKLIFFPITDIDRTTLMATHYSLCYIDNRDGNMHIKHYDSHYQHNQDVGRKFAKDIADFYGLPSSDIEILECSNQNNGYDCGVYLMAYMDSLIDKRGDHLAADQVLTPSYITQYRKKIRNDIDERIKQLGQQQ